MLAYEFAPRDRADARVRVQLNVNNLLADTDRQVLASNWNPTTQSLETFHYFSAPRHWSLSVTLRR
jgi:hypothetical protein